MSYSDRLSGALRSPHPRLTGDRKVTAAVPPGGARVGAEEEVERARAAAAVGGAAPQSDTVNGVRVVPVVREPAPAPAPVAAKKAKKAAAQQPSLFDDL